MGPLSDELLARIVALAADAIICINAEHHITFFNDGASRIFGYTSEEIMGRPLNLLIPERFHHDHTLHIDAFGEAGVVARHMGERSAISGRRQNGEEFPADAAIAKMIGPRGPIYSVVLRDVTEQRRAEALHQQLLEKTEAAVTARDEMLGLVSHDLRNPVNAVKMLASAILRANTGDAERPLPPAVLEHATVMLQAANQMDALIQDLLDVTRLDSGQLRLSTQPVAVHDIVNAALDTMLPGAEQHAVTLRSSVGEALPLVDADPDRMVQVLSNLLDNAIKFSPAGATVHITAARAAGKPDCVELTVSDAGSGISPEELQFVFDRFWQSRRTNRSGAGLGLAIARGIVRAHGGDITITSTPGEGTSVCCTLPVAQPTPS